MGLERGFVVLCCGGEGRASVAHENEIKVSLQVGDGGL